MADTTPEPNAAEQTAGDAKKPAARKRAASPRKSPERTPITPPTLAGPADPEVVATPDPEPAPASAGETASPSKGAGSGNGRSVLDGVRDNSMGPLAAGLLVALAVGLLLSVLVPNDPNLLAFAILGTLVSAAVGFTVRLLSHERGLRRQVETFVVTVIGVHVMSVTGAVGGEIPLLSQFGVDGPGFNEALIVALATPAVSSGAVLAGLTALIIVGWGRATDRHAR